MRTIGSGPSAGVHISMVSLHIIYHTNPGH